MLYLHSIYSGETTKKAVKSFQPRMSLTLKSNALTIISISCLARTQPKMLYCTRDNTFKPKVFTLHASIAKHFYKLQTNETHSV